ncbi:hypothetical protein DRQ33_03710 [bacterium]|nr:MAG: hypothetical protein DRQ33_03710 [bacterium]
MLITDTVGFIKKLPHNLIESFKSTLAETREADLILIISDASHSAISEHLEIVANELNNISAPENRIQVMNKIDLLTPEQMSYIRRTFPKSHLISAKTGTGIDSLKSFILDQAKKNQKEEYNEQN